MSREGDAFKVDFVRTVPYRTVRELSLANRKSRAHLLSKISSDKANIHPRLRLLNGGLVYSVQFGDAIGLVAKGTIEAFL